jgi:hypothetical protein
MELSPAYPWFGQGFGAISVPRYKFVPIRFTDPGEILRDPLRRPTLKMQWCVCSDGEGRVYLRATWDARRHIRSMDDQRSRSCGGWQE